MSNDKYHAHTLWTWNAPSESLPPGDKDTDVEKTLQHY